MSNDATDYLFELLTTRTFYVVDTEYTSGPDRDGNHIISIAVTPISGGVKDTKGGLYKAMNPGVPITKESSKVHGFTDKDVKGKRRFNFYASTILDAFDDPDGIWVSHTNVDLIVLRDELARLDSDGTTSWLDKLPTLPVIDTSTLPRDLELRAGHRGAMSLQDLLELAGGLSNRQAHNAKADSEATADALLWLLRQASAKGLFASINDLLTSHNRGTTRDPVGPKFIRSRTSQDPDLPPEHVARHTTPLSHKADEAELATFVDLVGECVELRCQYLRDEVREAAIHNGKTLIDHLTTLYPRASEPGQAGTLAGALFEVIASNDPDVPSGLAHTRALRWWAKNRPQLQALPDCDANGECPDCRAGRSCPKATLYQPVADIAILGAAGTLSRNRINDRLLGDPIKDPDRAINKWMPRHPEAVAWMLLRLMERAEAEGLSTASNYLQMAIDRNVHRVEPQLALRYLRMATSTGDDLTEPIAFAEEVLAHRNRDLAYDELAAWLLWTEQSREALRRAAERPEVTPSPRARPAGRVNRNPYATT